VFFFFNDTATTEIYTLSLHDALPIYQMELALRTSEALLQFNPEDPYEIRDRGLIYAQLDCEHVALNDLSYFVEQCPEDPISEMIRAQINNIAHKHIVLH